MAKIVNLQEIIEIASSLKQNRQSIVLAGGCFDILHIGHIKFLTEAKKLGNCLIILLESDEKVRELKGLNRPIFTQKERALVLASLNSPDYVVTLPMMRNDEDYHKLIFEFMPDVIAVTENDPKMDKKKRQAEKIHAKLVVIPYIKTFSSSRLAKIIGID